MDLNPPQWHKRLDRFWKRPIAPKIKCFNWLILLDRLPLRKDSVDYNICTICRLPETARHIFFYCVIAKEVWLMFGLQIPYAVQTFDIIYGFIHGLKKDANLL